MQPKDHIKMNTVFQKLVLLLSAKHRFEECQIEYTTGIFKEIFPFLFSEFLGMIILFKLMRKKAVCQTYSNPIANQIYDEANTDDMLPFSLHTWEKLDFQLAWII